MSRIEEILHSVYLTSGVTIELIECCNMLPGVNKWTHFFRISGMDSKGLGFSVDLPFHTIQNLWASLGEPYLVQKDYILSVKFHSKEKKERK